MRAAKGGAVAGVGGGERGAVLEGGETDASAGGHCDSTRILACWAIQAVYRIENVLDVFTKTI